AMLTYTVWENRYGKDPAIVGRKIRLNSVPTTVIGVTAPGLAVPPETQIWTPYIPQPQPEKRQDRYFTAFGKLAPGVSRPGAQAELAGLARGLAAQYPDSNKDYQFLVQSFTETTVKGNIRTVFLVLLGAVGFVLLIACANVANLLLARA